MCAGETEDLESKNGIEIFPLVREASVFHWELYKNYSLSWKLSGCRGFPGQ